MHTWDSEIWEVEADKTRSSRFSLATSEFEAILGHMRLNSKSRDTLSTGMPLSDK